MEVYLRTEAVKPGETFHLEEYESIQHIDWPPNSKMLYVVILGPVSEADKRGR